MESPTSSSTERKTLSAVRKVIPPPPSIGGSVTSTAVVNKLVRPPPPPSIGGSEGSVSGRSSAAGSKRGSESGTSARSSKKRRTGLEYASSDISDNEPELAPDVKHKLMIEQRKIIWIPEGKDHWRFHYDALILGRKIAQIEPENYVDTTYCNQELLQKIMDVKYSIKAVDQERFFELRTKLSSFVDMKGILFHNRDALRMANIDAMMGYQLSNPKNARGENLLKPNELLYFVDLCGAPGGASEYLLWKKRWYAHGFGFTSKSFMWDLPVKSHYSAESFEAIYGFWGDKGNGDIYNPEEVKFFSKQVKQSTEYQGVHVCIAQGGDTTACDEDRKELRVKYMIMSEFMIALDVLREGGHFVCKIHDMFTPFTVGLVYLMYRCFDSVAVYKPETGLPASSERYLLCKYKKGNRYVQEVSRYLMDCLTNFRNCQRLHKTQHDDVADIIELVPDWVIRDSRHFYQYILYANEEIGKLQLRQTDEINRHIRNRVVQNNYLQTHMEEIHKKATSLWGVHGFKMRARYTEETLMPSLRAAKLVRPYPPDILTSIFRDGEQVLDFATMTEELLHPSEWTFVPVGRCRGIYLGLGGRHVHYFNGTEWERAPEKLEMCNNSLVYADIVDEIKIFEDKQEVRSGFHIIDAMILGGKDIRALPYLERNELCQKFAKSMNKAVRDDLAAVRCRKSYGLPELPMVLTTMKREKLRGGSGPSRELILPIQEMRTEEASQTLHPSRTPHVFKPGGFSLFKTTKGNGVQGDFLYTLQNRLIWRFTEDVNLDPKFDGWREDAQEKFGPIHGATLIDFLMKTWKKK